MFQAGNACYGSPASALSALASSQVGAVIVEGGTAKVIGVQSVTDTAITYTLTPLAGGATVVSTVSLQPQPCGLLTASDALSISWAIVAVWLVAWGLSFIARHITRETETPSDYGNT